MTNERALWISTNQALRSAKREGRAARVNASRLRQVKNHGPAEDEMLPIRWAMPQDAVDEIFMRTGFKATVGATRFWPIRCKVVKRKRMLDVEGAVAHVESAITNAPTFVQESAPPKKMTTK